MTTILDTFLDEADNPTEAAPALPLVVADAEWLAGYRRQFPTRRPAIDPATLPAMPDPDRDPTADEVRAALRTIAARRPQSVSLHEKTPDECDAERERQRRLIAERERADAAARRER